MLERFNEITHESPVEIVTRQLRTLIYNGELNTGDVLPSERKLAEKMGVARNTIRQAINKLEFYGLLKTLPQSGTEVVGKGIVALENLIVDMLDFEEADFHSTVEIRNLLEIKSAGLAAIQRTEVDIQALQKKLDAYEMKMKEGLTTEFEDLEFHFQIADISGNSVLKLLMRVFAPDILKRISSRYAENETRMEEIFQEHKDIVTHIIAQNPKEAKNSMRLHLRGPKPEA